MGGEQQPAKHAANILLVDDNPANLLSLRALLEDAGDALIEAHCGENALSLVAAEDFAVILLDAQMKGIDGFETAQQMRRCERSNATPIIFLTAFDSTREQIDRAYSLGAVDYLVKPLIPEVIRAKVDVFVELFRRTERLRQLERSGTEAVLDAALDCVITIDPRSVVVEWNRAAETVFGYTRQDAIGREMAELIIPRRFRAAHHAGVARLLATGQEVLLGKRVEMVALRASGEEFPAELTIVRLPSRDRQLFTGFLRDITERQRAERQISEQREWLQVTLASIGDAVITTDREGRVTYLNPVAEQLTGWQAHEAAGRPLDAVFHIVNEMTRNPVENPALRALRQGAIVGLANHTLLIAKNGAERPIDDSAAPIRDARGETIGAVLIFRDVSQRRKAEHDLRASEQRFQSFMQRSPATAYIKDAEGRYLFVNRILEEQFQRPLEQWLGKTDLELFPAEDAERYRQNDRSVLASGAGAQFIETAVHAGETHYYQSLKFPLEDQQGAPLLAGMSLDITELRRTEQALREEDRRKDEFLATLAHELRNPLAPIRNGLQVMKLAGGDRELTEQARAMMERQVEHLVRMVDDLLDVSRVSRGKIELRKARIDVAAAVASAVETCDPVIRVRDQQLNVALAEEPLYVDADQTRLAQALGNLLQNAAKFTDRGGAIWLTARREGGEAVIRIKDTGVGIPAAMLPNIFDLFTQGDRSLEKSHGGLGIGLTLVKRLVELHGGRVAAHSAGQGMGSEFTVRLPIASAVASEPSLECEAPPVACDPRLRVLVVDDNIDAAESLAVMLRMMGSDVRTAHDGAEACDRAEHFRPHLMLLDIGMPRVNGYDCCRRIRAQPWAADLRIVALTGWGQEADKQRSREAGFDRHLVKPVEPAVLQKLIASLAGG